MQSNQTSQQHRSSRTPSRLTRHRKPRSRSVVAPDSRRTASAREGHQDVEERPAFPASPAPTGREETILSALPQPTFVPYTLIGPDGHPRPGWEMWIEDQCFGRADNQEMLLASYQRIQSPPESHHWRYTRQQGAFLPQRKKQRGASSSWEEEEQGEDEETSEETV